MLPRIPVARWLALPLLLGLLLAPLAPTWAGAPEVVCNVQNTPYFTEYFGAITVDGAPAPIGTVVEAVNSQGVQAGCTVVAIPGIYPYLRVYGADAATGTPGMANNAAVTFKVNGAVATSVPATVLWSLDDDEHAVNLSAQALPAAVEDLHVEIDINDDIKLTWTHVGGSVHHYEVWRSESPYFTPPAEGTRIKSDIAPAVNVGAPMAFPDPASHLGNTAINDYYVVLAVNASGVKSLVAQRAGAFDFGLVAGSN